MQVLQWKGKSIRAIQCNESMDNVLHHQTDTTSEKTNIQSHFYVLIFLKTDETNEMNRH